MSAVVRRGHVWDEGPRTNYEAKYIVEGRPILRLEATLEGPAVLHPQGAAAVLVGPGPATPFGGEEAHV